MYAIVQIGSSQFKVSEGDMIDVNRRSEETGKSITLDKILLFAKGPDIRVGQPYLKDVKVTARIIKHDLDEKIVVYQYRKRKNSAKKKGHRQRFTALSITQISA